MTTRSLRFGLVYTNRFREPPDSPGVAAAARAAEAAGYDTVLFPDHPGLGAPAPMLAAVAAAAATERIGVGTQVLNNDLRHAGVLVDEAATAVELTGGRFELGLGAGHMRAEYDALGLDFDPPAVRIAGLADTAALVRERLPDLPLLIGGNGDRLLTVAAKHADIVNISGFLPRKGGTEPTLTHFTTDGLADRIDLVRKAAGDRFESIELGVLVQQVVVTDDRKRAADTIAAQRAAAGRPLPHQVDPLDSPFLLLGSPGEIARQICDLRDRLGVSYVTVLHGRSDGFDEIVDTLAGT